MTSQKPSEKEMRERVIDYVSGALSPEQHVEFESLLSSFPDVEEQVRRFRVVTSTIDATQVRDQLEKRTSDLSIRVHESLREASPRRITWRQFMQWSPILVTASLVLMVLLPHDDSKPEARIFDEEMEQVLRGGSGDSLVIFADRDADFSVTEGSYENGSGSTSDLAILQDAAEEIATAAMPQALAPGDHVAQESLELLIHTELQDAEKVLKELEDVTS